MRELVLGAALAVTVIMSAGNDPAEAVPTPIEHVMPIEAPTVEVESGIAEFDALAAFENVDAQ